MAVFDDKSAENEQRATREAAAKWLESQRGRPQYRAAPHARNAVAKIMRPLSRKHGSGSTGLAQHWESIVGARFAKFSKPVKFSGSQGNRALIISAPGPAAALIMASSQTIIDRANTFLGAGHIQRLRIVQTRIKTEPSRTPPPNGLTQQTGDKLQSGLEKIHDPELKQALEKLGYNVLARDL